MLSSFELDLGQRGGWLVNESGLYSLILSSKLPSAKKFKKWVTSEVLPTIRKTGGYINNADLMVISRYWIKGYSGGLSFKSLKEVDEWASQKIEEDKKRKEEEEQRIRHILDTAIVPVYDEKYKGVFLLNFKGGKVGIHNSVEFLMDVFDKDSELYKYTYYEIDTILSNINYDGRHYFTGLDCATEDAVCGLYFSEIKKLNPSISDDDVISCDFDSYDFYLNVLEHITEDELREFVFELKQKEERGL